MATPNSKPALVRCTTCSHGILPVVNHLMRCTHSKYKVHTGSRICPLYIEGKPRAPQ